MTLRPLTPYDKPMAVGGNGKNGKNGQYQTMPGRTPRIADPELRHLIVEAVRQNMPYNAAAALAGVSETGLHLWKLKGNQAEAKEMRGEPLNINEQAYLEFMRSLKHAASDAIERNLAIIQTAAGKSWQAAAWLLERRHPQMFSVHRVLEVQPGEGAAPLTSDLSRLSVDELKELETLLGKAEQKENALETTARDVTETE